MIKNGRKAHLRTRTQSETKNGVKTGNQIQVTVPVEELLQHEHS